MFTTDRTIQKEFMDRVHTWMLDTLMKMDVSSNLSKEELMKMQKSRPLTATTRPGSAAMTSKDF
jgi:hypothetical protein